MSEVLVVNASPVITLAKIGRLNLPGDAGEVVVPLRHPLKFFENSHEGGKTGSKISGKSSCLLAFMFNFPLKTAAE